MFAGNTISIFWTSYMSTLPALSAYSDLPYPYPLCLESRPVHLSALTVGAGCLQTLVTNRQVDTHTVCLSALFVQMCMFVCLSTLVCLYIRHLSVRLCPSGPRGLSGGHALCGTKSQLGISS